MKTTLLCLILVATPFSVASPGKECLNSGQIRTLKKEVRSLENRLKDVLRREITAQLENEDPSLEKENARQLYFELRRARAELETANTGACQE